MTEERLKEIKDRLDEIEYNKNDSEYMIVLDLYNEVVRLRKIINEAKEYIEKDYYTIDIGDMVKEDLLDILDQNNLTLEQLTGVENE